MGQAKFVTMGLFVPERTKDNKQGYFRTHTLAVEKGTFSPKFLAMLGMY
jgi:hypothetical protein